jgi:U3 small nucleolar RNA-associated protein 18
VRVSLASDPRLRKLRDVPSEDTLAGREYERRLRRQFERLNPAPAWAQKAKSKAKAKRKRTDVASDVTSDEDAAAPTVPEGDDDGEADVNDILATTSLKARRAPGVLDKGTLRIQRVRDANLSARTEGAIKSLRFHPSPAVPLLGVAGSDRRVRLFNVSYHSLPSSS